MSIGQVSKCSGLVRVDYNLLVGSAPTCRMIGFLLIVDADLEKIFRVREAKSFLVSALRTMS